MSVYYGIFHFLMSHQVTHTFSFIVVKRAVVDVVVVVAHSTSAQQILSGWGLTVVCEPIHLGGGDSRRMANTRQCAGSNPQPSSQRASAVTTAPPCAPAQDVDKKLDNDLYSAAISLSAKPPLGVPLTTQDCLNSSGLVARKGFIAEDDAPVVHRLPKPSHWA